MFPERTLNQLLASINNNVTAGHPAILQLRNQVQLYQQHLFFKEEQQRLYKEYILPIHVL